MATSVAQQATVVNQPAPRRAANYATDSVLRRWQHRGMTHFLKQWRELRGLTQEQVAKAIGLEHKASIRKIEADPEKDLSVGRVNKLAEILRINPEDIYRSPENVNLLSNGFPDTTHTEGSPGGPENMVNQLSAWLEEASDVPLDLIPAARNMLKTLKKAVGEQRQDRPTHRVKGK